MRLAFASILLLVSPLIAVAQSNARCIGMAPFRSPGMTCAIHGAGRYRERGKLCLSAVTETTRPAHL
jgi:hypothetical protein